MVYKNNFENVIVFKRIVLGSIYKNNLTYFDEIKIEGQIIGFIDGYRNILLMRRPSNSDFLDKFHTYYTFDISTYRWLLDLGFVIKLK